MMMSEYITLFIATFVTFFVLIDSIGVAPMFAALTKQGSPSYRRTMAIRSTLIGGAIIFGFAVGGVWLLDQLHISIDAFRIAGGALLFLIALDMVFERRTERREHRVETVLADQEERPAEPDDVSVFPIGIPMLAGPGSIATAMLYMSNETDLMAQAVILSAIALNLLLCMVIFLMAGPLMRFLGDSISAATTRILGVILSALSVQLLVDGIRGAFSLP